MAAQKEQVVTSMFEGWSSGWGCWEKVRRDFRQKAGDEGLVWNSSKMENQRDHFLKDSAIKRMNCS